MSEHLDGRPVSATTYKNLRCRCDGCRAAAVAYQRRLRNARGGALMRVESMTASLAAAWVRTSNPEQWEAFRAKAYEQLGIERRPRGRPKKDLSHGA